jgi:glycine hydroxymethyltransferase
VQVVVNSKALGQYLTSKGYVMATGGTDNHLLLWDLRDQGITGSKMQAACDAAHITLNMNSVAGDVSAMTPGGVRIGMPAMTSRGLKEADFMKVWRTLCAAPASSLLLYCGEMLVFYEQNNYLFNLSHKLF